jgi:hypothetical protein
VLRKRLAHGAAAAARQVATQGMALAYVLSGSPLTRRVARLRRNIDDWRIYARYPTVTVMVDALLEQGAPAMLVRGVVEIA